MFKKVDCHLPKSPHPHPTKATPNNTLLLKTEETNGKDRSPSSHLAQNILKKE